MLYGGVAWDPVLIIAQIFSLQCLFYLTFGLAQAIFLGPLIGRLTISNVFNWRSVEAHNTLGWLNISSNVTTACLCAVYLMWIVERAKKCVDFAATIYILHFVATWVLAGFPASLVWWATNGVGLLVMALLGEWLCVQREMQDIPLGSARTRGSGTSGGSSTGAASSSGSQVPRNASGSSRNRVTEPTPLLEMVTVSAGSSSSALGSGVSSSAPRSAASVLSGLKSGGGAAQSPRPPLSRASGAG